MVGIGLGFDFLIFLIVQIVLRKKSEEPKFKEVLTWIRAYIKHPPVVRSAFEPPGTNM